MPGRVPEGHVELLSVDRQVVRVVVKHCGDVFRGEPARGVGDEHARLAHHAVAHRRDLDGSDAARDAAGVGAGHAVGHPDADADAHAVPGLPARGLVARAAAAVVAAPAPAAAAHLGSDAS